MKLGNKTFVYTILSILTLLLFIPLFSCTGCTKNARYYIIENQTTDTLTLFIQKTKPEEYSNPNSKIADIEPGGMVKIDWAIYHSLPIIVTDKNEDIVFSGNLTEENTVKINSTTYKIVLTSPVRK